MPHTLNLTNLISFTKLCWLPQDGCVHNTWKVVYLLLTGCAGNCIIHREDIFTAVWRISYYSFLLDCWMAKTFNVLTLLLSRERMHLVELCRNGPVSAVSFWQLCIFFSRLVLSSQVCSFPLSISDRLYISIGWNSDNLKLGLCWLDKCSIREINDYPHSHCR